MKLRSKKYYGDWGREFTQIGFIQRNAGMGGCRRWIRNVRSETGRVVLLLYLFLLVWNKRS